MASKIYALPAFLAERITPAAYQRWLSRKSIAHVKRDRARGNQTATRQAYMLAIHADVLRSGGTDAYTGQALAWDRISTYANEASKSGRREYKKGLCDLPTVDHVGDGLGEPNFNICSWRTNDCKNDLAYDELIAFCRAVLAHHERTGSKEELNG